MPLIKSKSEKAFKKNVSTEVKAGKPVKQAVAIAYSTKRAAKKAGGGSMDPYSPHSYDSDVDYFEAMRRGRHPRTRYSDDFGPEDAKLQREREKKMPPQSREQLAQSIAKLEASMKKREGKTQSKARGGKVTKHCW
jgi:hypothetical protein